MFRTFRDTDGTAGIHNGYNKKTERNQMLKPKGRRGMFDIITSRHGRSPKENLMGIFRRLVVFSYQTIQVPAVDYINGGLLVFMRGII